MAGDITPYWCCAARMPGSFRSLGRVMPKTLASSRANRKKKLSGASISGPSPSYVFRHRVADRPTRSKARPTSDRKICFPNALSDTPCLPALTPPRAKQIDFTRSSTSCSRISLGSTASSSKSTSACRTRSWSSTALRSSGSIVGICTYTESRAGLRLRGILSLDQADHIPSLPMFSVPVACYGCLVPPASVPDVPSRYRPIGLSPSQA